FRTIGAAQPEIFHRGTAEIDITEGLVRRCATDAQLVAVLCIELGKMIAEREARAVPRSQVFERPPLPDLHPSADNGADRTYLAELSPYDQARHTIRTPPAPPDPQALAQIYLTNAGYTPAELAAVAPLLQEASQNNTFESGPIPLPPVPPGNR